MSTRVLPIIFIIICSVYARRSGGYGHYPTSHGFSGAGSKHTHSYPHSTGLSGNTYAQRSQTYNSKHTSYTHTTELHHHYHYNPPQYISYGSVNHPVYHSSPPQYVYEYRDSGSRFDNLLTGLALYNLGRMSSNHDHYNSHTEYRGSPGEICKLGVNKDNGEYEETRIDCKLISSFIWETERQPNIEHRNTNIVTTVNITKTLINSNNTVVNTVTVQNTTIDALQAKGPSLKVTSGMNCFMIRISRDSSISKKKVECGLLQAYAQNSLRYNGCDRCIIEIRYMTIILIIQALFKI
ncbi:uncharacterized protein [Battus philenor]|uniref:uncharacterized protein n=1 Tax=Battus philenor TaxID=42288 RepID=UPI0035CF4C17